MPNLALYKSRSTSFPNSQEEEKEDRLKDSSVFLGTLKMKCSKVLYFDMNVNVNHLELE